MADIPYCEETPDGWGKEVENWEIDVAGDNIRIAGVCPTCRHTSETVYHNFRSVRGTGDVVQVIVSCNCGVEHEGRPDGRTGCGRAAPFTIFLDD
jgi:hypothetical protein